MGAMRGMRSPAATRTPVATTRPAPAEYLSARRALNPYGTPVSDAFDGDLPTAMDSRPEADRRSPYFKDGSSVGLVEPVGPTSGAGPGGFRAADGSS